MEEKKVVSEEKNLRIKEIIADLEKDMQELNKIKQRIKLKSLKIPTPAQNKKLIEEIIVPPLELLQEEEKEKD